MPQGSEKLSELRCLIFSRSPQRKSLGDCSNVNTLWVFGGQNDQEGGRGWDAQATSKWNRQVAKFAKLGRKRCQNYTARVGYLFHKWIVWGFLVTTISGFMCWGDMLPCHVPKQQRRDSEGWTYERRVWHISAPKKTLIASFQRCDVEKKGPIFPYQRQRSLKKQTHFGGIK